MPAIQMIVIGASAGGIEALRDLVGGLPEHFPAPVCIVMHLAPQSPSVLHEILDRSGRLPVSQARNGSRLRPGQIYVAPPDCHLLLEPGVLRVTKGPKENRFRPAIDPLFRSAAQVFGPAAAGVILTGNLDDGAAGLWAIKQLGGVTIVQEPSDALFPSMPLSAIARVTPDHVVPLAAIPALLAQLVAGEIPEPAPIHVAPHLPIMEVEVDIAKERHPIEAGLHAVAEPSPFACPECHGVLLQLKEAGRIRFRCHTGHAYSVESLLAEVSDSIERSIWVAIRGLEEGALLLHHMAEHVKTTAVASAAGKLGAQGARARQDAESIRKLVIEREPLTSQP